MSQEYLLLITTSPRNGFALSLSGCLVCPPVSLSHFRVNTLVLTSDSSSNPLRTSHTLQTMVPSPHCRTCWHCRNNRLECPAMVEQESPATRPVLDAVRVQPSIDVSDICYTTDVYRPSFLGSQQQSSRPRPYWQRTSLFWGSL